MNDRTLYAKITSPANLERAFYFAMNERLNDHFYDPLELKWYRGHKEELLAELSEVLKDPENYEQECSFSFFMPKNKVCYRRMVFIPLRDLVVRYAFVSVIADLLDGRLSKSCFANRRAQGKHENSLLLSPYAQGPWQNFVNWQRKAAVKNNFMLKTDISAFYDSISHNYLEDVLRAELKLPKNSKVIALFQKILTVNIESYSHLDNTIQPATFLRQGLPIGNNTEGFLANLYLMEIDRKMAKAGVEFGRYVDDMRIYAKNLGTLRNAIMILQESLLKLGLNLNSGKTELAENARAIEIMRSKDSDVLEYFDIDNVKKENCLLSKTDKGFKDQPKEFSDEAVLENEKDAIAFCKYLSWMVSCGYNPYKFVNKMKIRHVELLNEIIRKYSVAVKHASWLLIMATFYDHVADKVSNRAFEIIKGLLKDRGVNPYTRYRLVHYIATGGGRRHQEPMWIEYFTNESGKWLKEVCISFLKESAIELNLVAINALRVLEVPFDEIRSLVETNCVQPLASPLQNALNYLEEGSAMAETAAYLDLPVSEENIDYL